MCIKFIRFIYTFYFCNSVCIISGPVIPSKEFIAIHYRILVTAENQLITFFYKFRILVFYLILAYQFFQVTVSIGKIITDGPCLNIPWLRFHISHTTDSTISPLGPARFFRSRFNSWNDNFRMTCLGNYGVIQSSFVPAFCITVISVANRTIPVIFVSVFCTCWFFSFDFFFFMFTYMPVGMFQFYIIPLRDISAECNHIQGIQLAVIIHICRTFINLFIVPNNITADFYNICCIDFII